MTRARTPLVFVRRVIVWRKDWLAPSPWSRIPLVFLSGSNRRPLDKRSRIKHPSAQSPRRRIPPAWDELQTTVPEKLNPIAPGPAGHLSEIWISHNPNYQITWEVKRWKCIQLWESLTVFKTWPTFNSHLKTLERTNNEQYSFSSRWSFSWSQ